MGGAIAFVCGMCLVMWGIPLMTFRGIRVKW